VLYINVLESLLDNVKRPYNSTSDKESGELHALTATKWGRKALVMESDTDDEDEGDTDRHALKKTSNSRKKKSQDRKVTGKGKADHKWHLLSVMI